MGDRPVQRRLAAVLAADVAGYTRLMEQDTDGTVAAWQAAREEVVKPRVAECSGKIVKLTGDGFLVELPTIQDAVSCAIAMQADLADSTLDFRMGVNLGDIVDDGEDIHGEGVNIAARLEALADPGGICLSGEAHALVRNRVEVEYRDLGEHEVKHVTHPIRVYAIGAAAEPEAADAASTDSSNVSIAVLPFDNFSGDAVQDYFADGVTEDIITELARWKEFSVIARNSSFVYKGQAVKIQQVAADLGVNFVLEGSVRKGGNRARITAQLIDAATGHHVWADRVDQSGEDLFALQDAVTGKIVESLGGDLGALRRGQYGLACSKPSAKLEEYDYFLRGHQVFYGFTRESMSQARDIWLEGLERFPDSGLLRIKVGWTLVFEAIFGWAANPHEALAEAFALVDEGLKDQALPPAGQRYGLWLRATLHLWSNRDPVKALRDARTTIDLFPFDSETFGVLAPIPAYAGDTALAEEWLRMGVTNEPNPPMIYHLHAGKVLYMARKYEQARDALLKIDPPNFDMLRYLAASCAALGELDAAQAAIKQILEIAPPLTLAQLRTLLPYRDETDREHELGHLREAGMPEG